MNPVISSPGTGAQQRANLTKTSAVPSTSTPAMLLRALFTGAINGAKSISGLLSPVPSNAINFSITE